MINDTYKTIYGCAEAIFKDRSSKFLAYAYHIETVDDVKPLLDELRKKYYDATHHCYAYRLGVDGEVFRVNDDGEPSGTAGRPILGQMMSAAITDCLVVVIRYFGGTKLGVPGLINAYKESTAEVLAVAETETRTVDTIFKVVFSYITMNDVMRVIKDEQPRIVSQEFDNVCTIVLAIRQSCADIIESKMGKIDSVILERFEKGDATTR